MIDRIQVLGSSLIQHGPLSNRIYLMKLAESDMPAILDEIEALAAEHGYSKIFTKIPARYAARFESRGYLIEAAIPDFHGDREDGVFMSLFLDPERGIPDDPDAQREILELAERKRGRGMGPHAEPPQGLRPAGAGDVDRMSRLYAEVFPTYPFPIQDPEYLRRSLRENAAYYCIETEGRIVALSSAEMDPGALNVEMTDFATLPAALGRGYAASLLQRMEEDMRRRGFRLAYTIARSASAGMNITFAKLDYVYAGTLVNNTNISGRIESMNVWYKSI